MKKILGSVCIPKCGRLKKRKNIEKLLQELSELHGYEYCSTARPKKRGGGCAITTNAKEFTMKEVKLDNPNNLEVTAAIVKSKHQNSKNLTIITIALYSPPRSRKKSLLLDFIGETYQQLKTKYPDSYFLCGGDVNDLKWDEIENLHPQMKQCVTKATRKGKVLSVIITDLHLFYEEVKILPPLNPDIEGIGSPSDHSTPLLRVCRNNDKPRKSSYTIKTVRPIKQDGINEFGTWIGKESFKEVEEKETPNKKVKKTERNDGIKG